MNLNWLVGRHCTDVNKPSEWATAFAFADAVLYVEALWRITVDGQLRRTSGDDGQAYGLGAPIDACCAARELLCGRAITAVRVDLARGDLVLAFGPSHQLEIITDSHYEPWQLTAPGKMSLQAQVVGLTISAPEV